MTLFYTRNIPTLFRLQFLLFLVSTDVNFFSQILTTFPAPDSTGVGPEQVKFKTRPGWFGFEPTLFGCNSYLFQSIWQKNFSLEFDDISGSTHHRSRPRAGKVGNQTWMTQFCMRNVATLFGMQLLSFPAITYEKMFRSNFDDLSMLGHHRSRQSWKRGPDGLVLHPKHTHTIWCVVLIVSH